MTERPNKEMALRYWSDPTLKAWWWRVEVERWAEDELPSFDSDFVWRVGHEAPTEPPAKMCELAGVKFPMPMTEAPDARTFYWGPNPIEPYEPEDYLWANTAEQTSDLAKGLYQATREGAIQQGRAIAAAIKQAMEAAK